MYQVVVLNVPSNSLEIQHIIIRRAACSQTPHLERFNMQLFAE
jgi:hypothetical protein